MCPGAKNFRHLNAVLAGKEYVEQDQIDLTLRDLFEHLLAGVNKQEFEFTFQNMAQKSPEMVFVFKYDNGRDGRLLGGHGVCSQTTE